MFGTSTKPPLVSGGTPSFTLAKRTPDELGELFIQTAATLFASAGVGTTASTALDNALCGAARFVEAIAELQENM